MKILSMGDRVRTGRYTVHSRFARSVLLLDAAGRAVFIVDRSIGPGPLNLVVARPHEFAPEGFLRIRRNGPAPRFDSALPRCRRPARDRLVRVLSAALPRHAPPESLVSLFDSGRPTSRLLQARDRRIRHGLDHIAAGRLAEGVNLIRGCGEGLTPSGDDFLCGWMLACRLQGTPARARAILPQARGGNPVSNAFLELAARGRINQAVKRLVLAPAPARVRAVCAFGHSSGADLLCGLLFGLGWSASGIQQDRRSGS